MPSPDKRVYIFAPVPSFREFIRERNLRPDQVCKVDDVDKIRGVNDITIYVRGDWWNYHHLHGIADELAWMVHAGLVKTDPPDVFGAQHEQ